MEVYVSPLRGTPVGSTAQKEGNKEEKSLLSSLCGTEGYTGQWIGVI
jgi:hypothetical protein